MQMPTPFNARSVQPAYADGGGAHFAVGNHPVVITDSEVKATQDGNSGMLVLMCEAIDGPEKGNSMAYRLNIFNQSDKAREIAQRQLSSLCHVLGVYDVQDTTQLHGKPFVVVVKSQNDPKYSNSTQISGVLDMAGNDPGKAGAGKGAPQPSAQPPAGFSAPSAAAAPPNQWAAPASAAQPPAAPPAQAGWGAPPAAAPAGQPAWGGAAAQPAAGAPSWVQNR